MNKGRYGITETTMNTMDETISKVGAERYASFVLNAMLRATDASFYSLFFIFSHSFLELFRLYVVQHSVVSVQL